MRRFLILLAALLLGGMGTVQAPPDQFAQLTTMGMTGGSDTGVAFVGPFDGLSSPLAAYSLRRLLSSYTANKAIHVTCSGGTATSGDVGFTPTGDFDTTGYNNHLGTGSCSVDTWYDQSGNHSDLLQATQANQPAVTLNSANGHAVLTWGAKPAMQTSGSITQAAPFTFNAVGERTGLFTTLGALITTGATGTVQLLFWTSTNVAAEYDGVAVTSTATDSTYHSIFGVEAAGGGTNSVTIDGTTTNGSAGASNGNGLSSNLAVGAVNNNSNNLTGNVTEAVVWLGSLIAGNKTTVYNSQHTYYGTP